MGTVSEGKVVLLLDYYNRGSRDLVESFKNAERDFQAVVINDDGFLPEEVTNVFEFFLGKFGGKQSKPLYFNQIQVPDFWEISGNNTSGAVYDKAKERGRIFYAEPKNKRLVKVVDWLDENGVVRCSEHYNKQGYKYAITTFNKSAQKVSKSYYDAKGREVIVENFITSDIVLNYQDQTRIFKNRTEFVKFYFEINQLQQHRIFFNSLSVPFFVSNALAPAEAGDDILFWQEKTGKEIPANMKMIFNGQAPRCKQVIVQSRESFSQLKKLGAPKDKLVELGYIYSFIKQNMGRKEVLICTNTENVEKLKELLEALPMVKFHVAALTEMSGKLLSHESYDNAIMYPNVKMITLERLFMQCDFFLDINHEGEIVEATRRAFLHNQLILAFKETVHGREYLADENCFAAKDYKLMIDRIKKLLGDNDLLEKAIKSQQYSGLTAKKEDYLF